MKLQNKLIYLFSLFIITFSACTPAEVEDMPIEPSYISEENLFGCSSVQTYNVDFGSEHLKDMHIKAGIYYYATFDNLIIKDAIDGNTVLTEEMNVKKFITYNSKVIICATEGIFEVTSDFSLELKADVECLDLEISPEGVLLFTQRDINTLIHKLNITTNAITNYAPPPSDYSHGALEGISTHPINNEIWGYTSGKIFRYKDGEIIGSFDEEDSPFVDIEYIDKFFILPYDDGFILVIKNGFYQVYKYSNEEWVTLKVFYLNNVTHSDKDGYMGVASITDAIIDGDILYVSTTLGGCRGVHTYDISKNEELKDEDYNVIQDAGLPSQCSQGFYRSQNGTIYLFNQSGWVAVYPC